MLMVLFVIVVIMGIIIYIDDGMRNKYVVIHTHGQSFNTNIVFALFSYLEILLFTDEEVTIRKIRDNNKKD